MLYKYSTCRLSIRRDSVDVELIPGWSVSHYWKRENNGWVDECYGWLGLGDEEEEEEVVVVKADNISWS